MRARFISGKFLRKRMGLAEGGERLRFMAERGKGGKSRTSVGGGSGGEEMTY